MMNFLQRMLGTRSRKYTKLQNNLIEVEKMLAKMKKLSQRDVDNFQHLLLEFQKWKDGQEKQQEKARERETEFTGGKG